MTAFVTEPIRATSPPAPSGAAPRPRRHIAIVGHACSPYLGSEPGFTWKWATHLAAHHQVTCFCHPEHHEDIEKEMQARPPGEQGLRFVFVSLDPARDPWDYRNNPHAGIRLHYARWQHEVVDAVRAEHARTPFDLVHHVSWGSLNQPPRLWRTGLPFVWGPVGGGQTWPRAFLGYAGSTRQRLQERLRAAAVALARFNPAVVRAARQAALVFATNRETAAVLRRAGAQRVELLLDSGFGQQQPIDRPLDRGAGFTLLWAGRLEPRKGLRLALEALAALGRDDIRLLVAGDGPERAAIDAAIGRWRLRGRVELLGRVPYAQMPGLFARADAFLFTSLRDSMGSVVLEAMSAGLPVIALDHQGVAVAVSDETGVRVPLRSPRQAQRDLGQAMARLADDPDLRRRMSQALRGQAAANTWPARAQRMVQWYEEVLRAHRGV